MAQDFPEKISQAVEKAVKNTFTSICGSEPTAKQNGNGSAGCSGLAGIISFVGDPVWSLTLAIPSATAEKMAQKFAGFEIPFDSPDMGDVVGELANVLAGDVVAQLDTVGVKAQMSLPTVVRGTDLELLSPVGVPAAKLCFSSEQGDFWFKLAAAKDGKLLGRKPGT